MLRRLKDALPPKFNPEDRRRLFWIFPLLMVDVLMPAAHAMARVPFGVTFTLQVLAIIGMLWIFVRALRRANKQD